MRGFPLLLGARPLLGPAGGQHEVLAQGMSLETFREEQWHEVRMIIERDAEHLVRLALVPRRPAVDTGPGRKMWISSRYGRLDQPVLSRSVAEAAKVGDD